MRLKEDMLNFLTTGFPGLKRGVVPICGHRNAHELCLQMAQGSLMSHLF